MTDATSAPPTSAARYSESLHVLTTPAMRELVMGLAVIEARSAGPGVRPREGEAIRALLYQAAAKIEQDDPERFREAILLGRAELYARSREAGARRAAKPRTPAVRLPKTPKPVKATKATRRKSA